MIARFAFLFAVASLALAATAPDGEWHLPVGVSPPAVPADNPVTPAKVLLGRKLFYDADLSVDGSMSCASCHEQKRGFADGNVTRPGVHGDAGRRNVPGLANVAWLPSLTWGDPRVTTLEAQVAIPVFGLSPVEMGMHGQEREIARRLRGDSCYRRLFRTAFPGRRGAIDMTTAAMALASFERSLVSFDAPVDRGALSATARRGQAVFARDCASCHAGTSFTDGRFHVLHPARGADRGLAEITGRRADEGAFRTPPLRNVAVTGPWLHDGSAPTLADAVAAHGVSLDTGDLRDILVFLDALTDRNFLADPRFGYPDDACSGVSRSPSRNAAKGAVSATAASIAFSKAR